jgi:hypothetical protein
MNRTRGQWLVGLLSVLPAAALAGHGFMTAFANIEWLPDPGRTPDSAWYAMDSWQEEGQLMLTADTEAHLLLCLTFAREKLAEIDNMLRAENIGAAQTAVDRYHSYMIRATEFMAQAPSTADAARLATLVATALLEHQYIYSILYEELPTTSRALVPHILKLAEEQYQKVTRHLSPRQKDALLLKVGAPDPAH